MCELRIKTVPVETELIKNKLRIVVAMVVTIICLLLFVLLFFNQDVIYPKLALNSSPPSPNPTSGLLHTASKSKTSHKRKQRKWTIEDLIIYPRLMALRLDLGSNLNSGSWEGGTSQGRGSLFVHQN